MKLGEVSKDYLSKIRFPSYQMLHFKANHTQSPTEYPLQKKQIREVRFLLVITGRKIALDILSCLFPTSKDFLPNYQTDG